MLDNNQPEKTTEQDDQIDTTDSPAIFTAMWPNQPVNVCEEHARQLVSVGRAIGLQVPLIPYIGDDECINCRNKTKEN